MPKAPSSTPMVSIQRPCYAMASTDGQSADITMYGQIVDTQPTDWWTGEPIPGQYIIESEFLSDLQQVEHCSEITIRMDSVGGDAGVSILIHNRLRELAAKGTKLTCIVDGVAMSGGSLIMCACDTVKANPSSLVMIHKCWSLIWGNYNADELRKAADANDAWDKSQVSIYKRKTGLSETVLLHMMSDTTYMTGKEAVEKGFANELLDDAEPVEISASADRQTMISAIYESLAPGGAFIFVKKIVSENMDDLMVELYYDMKRRNGYSEEQIMDKRRSLENVLSPLKPEWNVDMLRTAGFDKVDMFWRCLNFCGWIAVK